jgi:HEAT repeat protein
MVTTRVATLAILLACVAPSAVAQEAGGVQIAKRPAAEWLAQWKAADEKGREALFQDAFTGANFQLVPESVPLLMGWLEDPDPAVRLAACTLLRVTDDVEKRSTAALTRHLEDGDPHVRANAAIALLAKTNEAEPGISTLRALERDGDLSVRREALDFLVSWARLDPTLIELFLQEARSEDEELRFRATSAFGGPMGSQDPRAIDALRLALGDPVERIRVGAAWRLVDVGKESDATDSVLVQAASSSDAGVRRHVLYGLGRVSPAGAREFVPILIAGLDDPEKNNRNQALASLATLGQEGVDAPEARDRLIELLGDADPFTRASAALTLGHVGADAETVAPALVKQLADPDAQTRFYVNHALQQAGPEIVCVLPQLIEALSNPDGDTRSNVAGLISMAGPAAKPAIAALTARLADPAANVRVWSAYALRSIGSESLLALPELVKLLASDLEPRVRVEAARAIAAFGPFAGSAVDALLHATADASDDVRLWSLFALGEVKVKSDTVVAALRDAAKSGDPRFAAEGNKALQKLGESFDAAAIAAEPIPRPKPPPVISRFVYDQSAFVVSDASRAAIVEILDVRVSRKGDVQRDEGRYRFRFLAKGQAEATSGDGELRMVWNYAPPAADATAPDTTPREPNLTKIRAGSFLLDWGSSNAKACELLWTPEEMHFEIVRSDQFEDLDLARFIR